MNTKLILDKAGLFLKHEGPGLLTGGGIILSIAAIIVACSKVKETQAGYEETQAEIEEEKIRYEEDGDRKHHISVCFRIAGKAILRFLKANWLVLLLEILSILGIWYSHGIMVKRNASLASTALLLTQQLESYRERVREKVGEEIENDLFYNLKNEKTGTKIEVLENGKTKKTPINEKVINGVNGPFDRIFDQTNHNYQTTPGNNMVMLKSIRESAQNIMEGRATDHSLGWYMMDEILPALGFEPTKESFGWGWCWGKHNGDIRDFIDIGINNYSESIIQDFVQGRSPAIPLHFNCHPLNPATDLGLL